MSLTKLTYLDIKPGLYWACEVFDGDSRYSLLEIRDASFRPDSWFPPGQAKVEAFSMGWDCGESDLRAYDHFIKAEILKPDGALWR